VKDKTIYKNIANCNPTTCISSKIMKCNRIVANIFRKHLQEFSITDSQLSILFVVAKSEDITQKTIADYLALEKSTVNRNLDRLIQKQYISDSKQSAINLTEKGADFLEKVIPHWDMAMKEIRNILSEEGESALSFLTQKLIN
jgi:DNA-binding MarR family transcriptional regulator